MVPRLYAAGTTVFTNEGLGALADALSCVTTTAVNGVPSLTMTYPTTGAHAEEIGQRCVIVADRDRKRKRQPYMVLTVDKSTPGIMKIYAEHLSVCLLDGIGLGAYTASNLSLAISTMGSHATEALPVTISTELSSSAPFNHATPSTVKRALGGMEGSLLDTYGGEWDFVDLAAVLRSRMGTDNGVIIRWGKNLSSLRVNIDWSGVYTGIYPYWENDGTIVQMNPPVYSLGTFDFTRVLMLDVSSEYRDQPTAADLLAYAQAYAASHDLTSPVYSWSVGFLELRGAPEYASVALLEDVGIGDTVRIYLPDFDVNATARVVKETYDVLLEQYQKLEIGSVKASLASTVAKQAAATQTAIKTATNSLYDAIQAATEAITGNKGGYIVTVMNAQGEPQELLIMDTDDISTAVNVWRFNLSGWGHSSTGYAGPYTLAATADGQINATMITTGTLAANMVTACQLVAGTIKSADGTTFVLDLSTGTLSIDGTSGGINLKNCGIYVTKSQTYAASSYSSSDTTRVQNILLGTVTPTSADYTKYDYYGDGVITTADLLLTQVLANGSTNLTVTWNCQIDTSKSQILRIWRQNTGANTGTQNIFLASTAGVKMLDITAPTGLSAAPTDHQPMSYDFTVSSSFSAGGITFPTYSKGRYVATGTDAVMWAISADGGFYIAFRNNGNWANGRSFNHQRISQSVSAGTAMAFSLADGEIAALSYRASSSAGNVDITLNVNGSACTHASYTYAGSSNNYTSQKIFARASSGTFEGFIAVHNGLVEVWGSGRRGTDNVRGDVYLAYSASSVTSLTFSAAGTVRITKL